jgi:hypothetical protein
VVVAASAYLLTPHWKQLWPPRMVCIPLLAAYLFAIYASLKPLAARVEAWRFIAALAGTQFAIAGIIAKSQSLTTARVALLGAGALAGYAVLLWRTAKPAVPVAIALPFAMLAGGWAFCGAIQPQPDEWGLLIAPFAPAALWLTVAGPLNKLTGKPLFAAQVGVVLAVLAASAAVVELL